MVNSAAALDHVEHGDVGVTIAIESGCGRFYAADDGSRIPEDEREHVFEAGYSSAEDGTGFGLSIVNRIVDAHDREVTLAESDGGGVRIEITVVDEPT